MLNHLWRPDKKRAPVMANYGLPLLAASILIFFFLQVGCSKKNQAAFTPSAPSKVAFFPLNVNENQTELQWAALATPVLLAQISEKSPDLEVIPFWESMPVAIEWAGASRIFNQASAQSAVGWLSAEWGSMGEVSQSRKNRVEIIVDFVSIGGKQIPFRYMKTARIDTIGEGFNSAINQFLRYLAATPLKKKRNEEAPHLPSMKRLAEALDREYGWFAEAEPGKAEKIVAELLKSDENLARFLFSPETYPQLKSE